MTVYNISYDLCAPGRDYEDLYNEIKKFEIWAHPVESTWLIACNSTAAQVRDQLLTVMDSNDKLLVTACGKEAAWFNLDKEVGEWIKNRL
jgi:hypothetical protein